MAENYLERLVAEWYEYQGYFVRRNVFVGKLPGGGYECELDIVAFHPGRRHLVHLEPSMDALGWAKRDERFGRKFRAGRRYIPELFKGLDIPDEIEQIAVLGVGSKRNRDTVGGGRILLVRELIIEILTALRPKGIMSEAVPEHLAILRTLQFVNEYRKDIKGLLDST